MTRSVLVIDDSKLARMVVSGILARLQPDWTVIEAAGAEEALPHLHRADMALVDFNMPGADGLQVARLIRDSYPAMPIAIVSANAQDAVIAGARAVDAAFIPKPVTSATLAPFLAGAALRLIHTRRKATA